MFGLRRRGSTPSTGRSNPRAKGWGTEKTQTPPGIAQRSPKHYQAWPKETNVAISQQGAFAALPCNSQVAPTHPLCLTYIILFLTRNRVAADFSILNSRQIPRRRKQESKSVLKRAAFALGSIVLKF